MSKPFVQSPSRRWILWGIPTLILLGFPMHSMYEWAGSSPIVGAIAPVNESIWEHLKLTFWPMLLWWLAGYFVLRKSQNWNPANWVLGCAVAEFVCPLVIASFYYTYTGSLGIQSIALDILSLFLGVLLAQCLALHMYHRAKRGFALAIAPLALLIVMAILYTAFTFAPPHLPLFQDAVTKKYGI